MFYKLLTCFLFLSCINAYCESFTSRLQEIADGPDSEKMLLFTDGRIAWTKDDLINNTNLLPGIWYNVLTNEKVEVEKIAALGVQRKEIELNPSFAKDDLYQIDTLDEKTAEEFYYKLDSFHPSTASSDRTHLWAYQLYQEFKIKGSKFFLFPNLDQIRNQRLQFWYYVGLAFMDKQGAPTLFDPVLSKKPLSLKAWKSLLIDENTSCTSETVNTFEINNDKCQMIELNMFYRRPIDILRLQIQEFIRSHFYDSEVEESRFSSEIPG